MSRTIPTLSLIFQSKHLRNHPKKLDRIRGLTVNLYASYCNTRLDSSGSASIDWYRSSRDILRAELLNIFPGFDYPLESPNAYGTVIDTFLADLVDALYLGWYSDWTVAQFLQWLFGDDAPNPVNPLFNLYIPEHLELHTATKISSARAPLPEYSIAHCGTVD